MGVGRGRLCFKLSVRRVCFSTASALGCDTWSNRLVLPRQSVLSSDWSRFPVCLLALSPRSPIGLRFPVPWLVQRPAQLISRFVLTLSQAVRTKTKVFTKRHQLFIFCPLHLQSFSIKRRACPPMQQTSVRVGVVCVCVCRVPLAGRGAVSGDGRA